jgi:hypothetical protein
MELVAVSVWAVLEHYGEVSRNFHSIFPSISNSKASSDTVKIAPIPKAANWAVGTFVFVAFANHEFCQYRRFLEKSHMKRAVEIIDRKKAVKEAEAKQKREERRRRKEEADKAAEEAAKKSSWKFW